jgi:hypothetical protein
VASVHWADDRLLDARRGERRADLREARVRSAVPLTGDAMARDATAKLHSGLKSGPVSPVEMWAICADQTLTRLVARLRIDPLAG